MSRNHLTSHHSSIYESFNIMNCHQLFLYVAVDIYVELACSKYGYNEEQVIVDCIH